MATTLIEQLVVGITGNPAPLGQALRAGIGMVRSFASDALAALAPLGVGGNWFAALQKFEQLQLGQKKMAITLETAGMSPEQITATAGAYKAFADQVAAATLVSKGAAFGMLDQVHSMGTFGNAARDAVADAVGLANGNEEAARGFLRLTVAMREGRATAEQLSRQLGLGRGMKDQAKLLEIYQQRVSAGFKKAALDSESTSGQLTRLGRSFGMLGQEAGGIIAGVLNPVVSWLNRALIAFRDSSPEVKKWGGVVAASLLGVTAIGPAMTALSPVTRLVGGAISMVASTLSFLVVKVAAGIPLMAAYNVVMLAWRGVMMAANAAAFVFNTILTATSAIVSGLTIAGTVVGLVALGGAFVIVGAAAYAVYQTVGATWSLLSNSKDLLGPLAEVGKMFGSWGTILQGTFRSLLAGDFSLAGRLLYAGFSLAKNQIADLFPPLWTFIKSGFSVLATYVGEKFSQEFQRGLLMMVRDFAFANIKMATAAGALGTPALAVWRKVADSVNEQFGGLQEKSEKSESDAKAGAEKAAKAFGKGFNPSDATKAAQAEIDALMVKVGKLPSIGASAEKLFNPDLGSPFRNASKEIHAFDSVLAGSAEANRRWIAYMERFNPTGKIGAATGGGGGTLPLFNPTPGGGGSPVGGAPGGGTGEVVSAIRELIVIAQQIGHDTRDLVEARKFEFEGAGL